MKAGFIKVGAIVAGAAIYQWAHARSPEQLKTEQSVYYSGCSEARAAGAAPIHAGQPGYRDGLDDDGDGIACEPYHGVN